MRFFWLSCVVLLVGCGTRNQALVAPCVGKPATGALGDCPTCEVDSDCRVLSNLCDSQAYCVHKDSSWMLNTERTCTDKQMYLPTLQNCRCLAHTCDWHI
jgi:hypothetical protein